MLELDDKTIDKLLESVAKICDDIIKATRDIVNILEAEKLRMKINQIDINSLDYNTFNYLCEAYEEYKARISKVNNNPTNSIKYKILI